MNDGVIAPEDLNAKIAHEHYYARFHALGAAGALLNLQKKLQASPWLQHLNKFSCEMDAARLRANNAACVEIYWRAKLAEIEYEKKFNPNQPRVPAGNAEGGQWTYVPGYARGKELQDFSDYLRGRRTIEDIRHEREGEVVEANLRRGSRGGGSRMINGRSVEMTPGQSVRVTAAEIEAREAVRRVRELDPAWRRPDGAYETVEGEISHLQGVAQAARQRIGEIEQGRMPLRNILMPEENLVGNRSRGASSEVRTITSLEFEKIKIRLLNGAREISPKEGYNGSWYQRSDGSVFGLRSSETHGETIDIIQSYDLFAPGFRIHRK